MSPNKLSAKGIGGCVLVPGGSHYRLKDGTQTYHVAVTVSLLHAEPSLRRLSEGTPIACDKRPRWATGWCAATTMPSCMASHKRHSSTGHLESSFEGRRHIP